MEAVALHGPRLGIAPMCAAMGLARATYYRHLTPRWSQSSWNAGQRSPRARRHLARSVRSSGRNSRRPIALRAAEKPRKYMIASTLCFFHVPNH
jgi:uncharacterized membrane protein